MNQTKSSWKYIIQSYCTLKILRPQSIHNLKRFVETFTKIFDTEFTNINKLTPEIISRFRDHFLIERGCSAITWNSYCRSFKALMSFAIEHQLVIQKKILLIRC